MIRLRWSAIEDQFMATRRGYVVRVWRADPNSLRSGIGWSVKAPGGVTHMGRAPTWTQAKRKARNLLVKLTPAVKQKEQLDLEATQ